MERQRNWLRALYKWRVKIRTKWQDDFCRNTYEFAIAYIKKPSSWPAVKPRNGTGYKSFPLPSSKQGRPWQACITWMNWAQSMFCAICRKSFRDTLAVNGRKELERLGITKDRQPASTTCASLCLRRWIWQITQSTLRKASADQRIQLTSTISRAK